MEKSEVLTFMAGSPVYSMRILPQKQPPLNVVSPIAVLDYLIWCGLHDRWKGARKVRSRPGAKTILLNPLCVVCEQ